MVIPRNLTGFPVSVESGGGDLQGPVFINEPPHRVEFSNSSGGKVDCTAHGSPPPEVEWIFGDGTAVYQVRLNFLTDFLQEVVF